MAWRYLDTEDRDGLRVVAINRPPANALVPELMEEGRALVGELLREPPRAVVLTGAGDFFSGGVDLKVAPTLTLDDQRRMVEGINALFAAWYAYPHPVVAAVNGHAVAGGLILALCADHRIAAAGASYGLTEVRVGIPFPAAALGVVQAELEPGVARRLVLGAELIDAERAHEWGVVDEVAPPEQVLPRALEVARELAALPAHTFAAVKRQLRAPALEGIRSDIDEDPASTRWLHDETRAAAASALSKQHPG